MNRNMRNSKRSGVRGFSLIELMVVILMITIVLAAVLTQLEQVQQRASTEQGRVDDFQQARDFVDQIYNDTRQMGFPNVRDFDTTVGTWILPRVNDPNLAVGLVKLTATQLEFQGDVDGSGKVSVVSYMLNGSGTCATCFQRAQVTKVNGDPVTGETLAASAYNVEVQNVKSTTIFSAYDSTGTAIALPIDIDSNPSTIPTVRTIQISLSIASSSAVDSKTGQQIEADIGGTVQVVNCSMANTATQTINGIQVTCQ